MSRKSPVSPSLTIKLRSESVINHEIQSKIFGHEKTPETLNFQGFSHLAWSRLTLAELRSAASLLEAVLLSLFHSGVSGEESGSLYSCPEFGFSLYECTCYSMSDSSCLSGISASEYIDIYVISADGRHSAKLTITVEL